MFQTHSHDPIPMKTTFCAALVALLLLPSHELRADSASPHNSDSGAPARIAPSPVASIEPRERPVNALAHEPQTTGTNASPQQVGSRPTDPSVTDDESSYAADAYRLCALLEGWPGQDEAETQRLLAGAFVEPLRRHIPGITKEQMARLASEFEPKISRAFQNLAATVSREHFTHAELRQLIQFFESSLGRKYARSYPAWKDRIAAGDGERQKLVAELLDRARELVTRDGQ